MDFDQMMTIARTGDKIVASSSGPSGLFIRMFTFASYTHRAVLSWDHEEHRHTMLVDEMVETRGHNTNRSRQWFVNRWRKGQKLYLVIAPPEVRNNPEKVKEWIQDARHLDAKYGYLVLPIIFLVLIDRRGWIMPRIQKLFRIDPERLNAVCSIWTARLDKDMGYETDTIVAPAYNTPYDNPGSMYLITPSPGMLTDKQAVKVSGG